MVKKLLIISSDITGHGHKSITEALVESFGLYHPEVEIKVIDGFIFAGPLTKLLGEMYGKVTRISKETWKFLYDATNISPDLIDELLYMYLRSEFLCLIDEFQPDLILSVHPFFNSSITKILRRHRVNIPFVVLIADLISISSLWINNRATATLCPTEESRQRCLAYGMKPARLVVTGLPVRARFYENIGSEHDNSVYTPDRPLKCLIMSGGEGVGNMNKIAKILLDNFNVHVFIVTGRNTALRKKLDETLKVPYGDKVTIYGYITNLQDIMAECDVAFNRGSPNVGMEAVACALPMVITGALPGQEEENPDFFRKYNLAIICKHPYKIKSTMKMLLENDGEMLNMIKETQKRFRKPETAKIIVDFLMSVKKKAPRKPGPQLLSRRRLANLRTRALRKSE